MQGEIGPSPPMDTDEPSRLLLLPKINVLISQSNDTEMHLVALILLTRVTPDDNTAYRSCCEKLLPLMEWLLLHGISAHQQQQQDSPSLCRLVALHFKRCVEIDDEDATTAVLVDQLGEQFIMAIEQHSWMIRQIDVLLAMRLWLDKIRKSSRLEKALFALFEASVNYDPGETTKQDEENKDDEQLLLETTMNKLLDQSTNDDTTTTTTTPEQLDESWIEIVADILTRGGCRIAPLRLPSFVVPMLLYWKKKKSQHQILWAKVVLNVMLRTRPGLVAVAVPPDHMTDLILACVITTNADESLRELAWSVVVALTTTTDNHDGWDWCIPSITVLLRILVGEWRIQLQHCHLQSTNRIVESCGMALISAVRFMASLATSEEKLPLSMEQIIHVKRSFHESFQTTIEYLLLSENNDDSQWNCIVMRVLGAFLAEMDPFEEHNKNTYFTQNVDSLTDDDCGEIPSLMALAIACETVDDAVTLEMLLPAVAVVLELSLEVPFRVSLLERSGLLGTIFTDFMGKFFCNVPSSAPLVELACESIETWFSVTTSSCDTSKLQATMVLYLDQIIKKKIPRETAVSCVSPVLAIYATLQGDSPPEDEKSISILQTAWHLCISDDDGR